MIEDREIQVRAARAASAGGPRGGGRGRRNNMDEGGVADPSRLFIGNLAWGVTSNQLYELLAPTGAQTADVQQKPNGTSKGYALVQMASPEAAQQIVEQFNGYELEGREMMVKFDRKGY